MPLNSYQLKKLSLHLMYGFGVTMFEISKRLPKPEDVRASEWMENNTQRVKLAVAAKMMKCHTGQRQTPTLAL